MKKQRMGPIGALAVAAAMLVSPAAYASLDFELGTANVPLTGPFGTVSLILEDSTTATVTLTAATGYTFGDGSTLGLNLASPATMSLSSLELTQGSVHTPSLSTVNYGSQTVDGWGQFNFTIDLQDGYGSSVSALSFTLVKTDGAWGSESDILALNGSGLSVVGHVMDVATAGPNQITGYAVVPEPTTVMAGALLLLPLGASAVRIFRRNRQA